MKDDNNKKGSSKAIKLGFIVVLFCILILQGFAGFKVYTLSHQREIIKSDYSTVHSIVFGLFSISDWKDKITGVVHHKLHTFDLSNTQLKTLETEVTDILHALINKAVSIINEEQKTIGGKIKKAAFNTFVNTDKLHDQVPEFSKVIIEKVNSPASKKRLTKLAEGKMVEFEKETYDSSEYVERTVTDSIFTKYNAKDYESYENLSRKSLDTLAYTSNTYTMAMLASIILLLSMWWIIRNRPELYTLLFIMSVLSASIFLIVGLNTTMIEVDARVEKMELLLMGKKIVFDNQVLFFQSKSIMAVVKILLTTGQYDSFFVGILLLCFSILFPFIKLISLGIYLLGKQQWTKSSFVYYFAFKSGKWSMADVMVIGILMTYIGFNGILESQLENLNIHNDSLTSITTNNTSLQPGYIIFVGFVLFGLILSEILKKITHTTEKVIIGNTLPE